MIKACESLMTDIRQNKRCRTLLLVAACHLLQDFASHESTDAVLKKKLSAQINNMLQVFLSLREVSSVLELNSIKRNEWRANHFRLCSCGKALSSTWRKGLVYCNTVPLVACHFCWCVVRIKQSPSFFYFFLGGRCHCRWSTGRRGVPFAQSFPARVQSQVERASAQKSPTAAIACWFLWWHCSLGTPAIYYRAEWKGTAHVRAKGQY